MEWFLFCFVVASWAGFLWHGTRMERKLRLQIKILEDSLVEARMCITLDEEETLSVHHVNMHLQRQVLERKILNATQWETRDYMLDWKENKNDVYRLRDSRRNMSKKELEELLKIK